MDYIGGGPRSNYIYILKKEHHNLTYKGVY